MTDAEPVNKKGRLLSGQVLARIGYAVAAT